MNKQASHQTLLKAVLWLKLCISRVRGHMDDGVEGRVVMIQALDPDPGLDFQFFGNSGSGFGPSRKQDCNMIEML